MELESRKWIAIGASIFLGGVIAYNSLTTFMPFPAWQGYLNGILSLIILGLFIWSFRVPSSRSLSIFQYWFVTYPLLLSLIIYGSLYFYENLGGYVDPFFKIGLLFVFLSSLSSIFVLMISENRFSRLERNFQTVSESDDHSVHKSNILSKNKFNKNSKKNPSNLLFSFLIGVLTIFTILMIVGFSIDCEISNSELYVHCMYNENSWVIQNLYTIIVGILTASAAILAITFIITEVIITNISKHYSPHVLDRYLKQKTSHAVFYAWILMTTFSAIFLFSLDISNAVSGFIMALILIDGFIFSLALFAEHYHKMIQVVNPFTLIDIIGDEGIENMEKS